VHYQGRLENGTVFDESAKHGEPLKFRIGEGSVIEGWEKGYKTFVGERGIRLSGGQRQRIGIARALYKKADVIVFDEATSSLDNDTESAVMEAIYSLGDELTVIIVAHRLTTLKNCTQVVEIVNGRVKRDGTYEEIVGIVT